MMMTFAKEIMGKTDHLEDKLAFLQLQSTKEYFYVYLRCFICGMSCQKVREIYEQGKHSVDEISEMMAEDMGERFAEQGNVQNEVKELQEETVRLHQQLLEIKGRKERLEEVLDVKERENSNLDASIAAKDYVQKQLQEKIQLLNEHVARLEKENENLRKRPRNEEYTVEHNKDIAVTKQKEQRLMERIKSFFGKAVTVDKGNKEDIKTGFMKDELAKESFRTEVLLNPKFSSEQRNYLFTLLEEGESYVNIRPFANPGISAEDMKRYYQLCTKGRSRS